MKTYKNIRGYFGFESFYHHFSENILKDGMNIVEVGVFLGQSTAYMAQKIKDKKLKIKFTAVDHWQGSDGLEIMPENKDMFKQFCDNMTSCEVRDFITILKKNSVEAAADFADHSLDLVFIDASHDYDNVKKDIAAWAPKIKSGGILAGDDYHPTWHGVVKAVDECFGWNVQKDKLQAWYVYL